MQGGARGDIGRGGNLRKGLVGLQSGLVFSTTELERSKGHGRIFQIGIIGCLLEHGAIPLLGGILAFHGIKPTGGKIGGGESNARFLGLTSGQLELDRRGLVEFLSEENFAQTERAGGSELAGLKFIHEFFVASASCGGVAGNAVALGESEKRPVPPRPTGLQDQEFLVFRNRELGHFAGVKIIGSGKRFLRFAVRRRGVHNHRCRLWSRNGNRRGYWHGSRHGVWIGDHDRRGDLDRMNGLGSADFWRQVIHPGGILITRRVGRGRRKGTPHLDGFLGDQRDCREKQQAGNPHSGRLVANATFQMFARRQVSRTSTT